MGRRTQRSRTERDETSRRRGEDATRSVAAHVRDRQRAVAEREASRLARPEQRVESTLGHADRKKSAVNSTPFGVLVKQGKDGGRAAVDSEYCGPFNIARQFIAEREEARRQEQEEMDEEQRMSHPLDEAMEEIDMEKKRKAHPSLQWKSRLPASNVANQSIYAKRQRRAEVQLRGRAVPSLFQLCVSFLVENFEYVESLGDVGNSIRTEVIKELVAADKLNGQSFRTVAETGIEALEVVDCSQITPDDLSQTLRELVPSGLRYLVLDQCGRCFGSRSIDALVSSFSDSPNANLFALSIGGAYLLKDEDASKIIKAASRTLSSIQFKACPLLGKEFTRSISDSFASTESSKLLELSLEDLNLDKESLEIMLAKPEALKDLKSLSLRRIEGLDDDIVLKILQHAQNIESLDLSSNLTLTDNALSGIRNHCGALRALNLSGLKHLTCGGLEALFLHVPGTSPPPMLTSVDLGNCYSEAVTDDVIDLVAQAATRRRDADGSNTDDASNTRKSARGVEGQRDLFGGLVRLDIQGSVKVTDTALEHLVTTSAKTLQELNLSFCPNITDKGLGYLIDRCSDQLGKIDIWGCAQLSDESLDGHRRVDDPTLAIVGAWMKKNTSRTIR